MRYQVKVAGKIFEGTDFRILLKRAVEAKKASDGDSGQNGGAHRFRPTPADPLHQTLTI